MIVLWKLFRKKCLTADTKREHAVFINSIHCMPPQNKYISNVLEKPNINNRTLLVGPFFSGKTYLMLKILSRKPHRDNYIITKSPPEQHSISKINAKEKGEGLKPLNEYKNAIIVSDGILGTSNSKYIDQFFIGERQFFYIFIIYHNPMLIYQKEHYEQ